MRFRIAVLLCSVVFCISRPESVRAADEGVWPPAMKEDVARSADFGPAPTHEQTESIPFSVSRSGISRVFETTLTGWRLSGKPEKAYLYLENNAGGMATYLFGWLQRLSRLTRFGTLTIPAENSIYTFYKDGTLRYVSRVVDGHCLVAFETLGKKDAPCARFGNAVEMTEGYTVEGTKLGRSLRILPGMTLPELKKAAKTAGVHLDNEYRGQIYVYPKDTFVLFLYQQGKIYARGWRSEEFR